MFTVSKCSWSVQIFAPRGNEPVIKTSGYFQNQKKNSLNQRLNNTNYAFTLTAQFPFPEVPPCPAPYFERNSLQ